MNKVNESIENLNVLFGQLFAQINLIDKNLLRLLVNKRILTREKLQYVNQNALVINQNLTEDEEKFPLENQNVIEEEPEKQNCMKTEKELTKKSSVEEIQESKVNEKTNFYIKNTITRISKSRETERNDEYRNCETKKTNFNWDSITNDDKKSKDTDSSQFYERPYSSEGKNKEIKDDVQLKSRTEKQNKLKNYERLDLGNKLASGLRFSLTNVDGIIHEHEMNGNHSITRNDLLMSHLLLNKISVMAVMETHLKRGLSISDDIHALCNWERTDRRDGSAWGGTGVFIDRKIQYEKHHRKVFRL